MPTCASRLSFSADTLVQTPSGEQPIARLQVGEHVTSYDPTTGKATTQTITHVFINHDSDRLDVTLAVPASSNAMPTATAAQDAATAREQRALAMSHGRRGPPDTTTAASAASSGATSGAAADETIHTTANHPWLTADRGWVEAGQLHADEPVRLLDGATAAVVGLHAVPGAGPMWDLSLRDVHTFAVGASRAVVHNTDGPGCVNGAPRRPDGTFAPRERPAAATESDVLRGTNAAGEVTSRSSFRESTVENAWNNAVEGPNGGRLCPTCGYEVRVAPGSEGVVRDWDVSHNPSWTNREFPLDVTRQFVVDNYQEGTSLECIYCNRSAGNNDARFNGGG